MLPRSLPMENRKGLPRDVFNTFETHAGTVYDVTVTDCGTQNDSPYGSAFQNFRRRFFFKFKSDDELGEKLRFFLLLLIIV